MCVITLLFILRMDLRMNIKDFFDRIDKKQLHIYCFSNGKEYYAFDYYNLMLAHTNRILNEILDSLHDPSEFEIVYDKYSDSEFNNYWNLIANCLQNNIFISEENEIKNIGESNIGLLSFPPVHKCNLNCTYCFASAGENYRGIVREFNKEKIENLLNFTFDFFEDKDSIRLDLVSGGEPLLAFETIKELVFLRDQMQEKTNKNMMIWLCTNGTLLNEEICDFLNQNNISIGISLDGDKKVHDKYRKFKDESGTYSTIVNNINFIKNNPNYSSKFKDIWGLTVITPQTESIVDIIKHHKKIGINNVQMKLVRSVEDEFVFDEESLVKLESNYNALCEFLYTECLKNNSGYIKMILNDNDYFGKILRRLLLRQIVINRCQAGKNKFSISANGDIYPCDSFVGNEKFRLGNLNTGMIEKNALKSICVNDREECQKCWGRYLCGGDCFHNSYLKNGNVLEPDKMFCKLQKHLIVLALMLIDKLNETIPNTVKELTRFLELKEKVN